MRLRLHNTHPDDVFITADTHFHHQLQVDIRRFPNKTEMDLELIERINETVGKDQVLFHLGDFGFGNKRQVTRWRQAIRCRNIFFARGNHDQESDGFYRSLFTEVADVFAVSVGKDRLRWVGCHFAFRTWWRSGEGSWHAHGHSHGNLKDDPFARSTDAGVDNSEFVTDPSGVLVRSYRPLSWPQFRARVVTKTFRPVDHHGAKGGPAWCRARQEIDRDPE